MSGAQGHSPPCCWVGALPHTDFPPLADLGVPGLPGDPLPRPGANFGGLPALFRCCFLDIPTSPHLSPVKSRPTEHMRKLRPRERRRSGVAFFSVSPQSPEPRCPECILRWNISCSPGLLRDGAHPDSESPTLAGSPPHGRLLPRTPRHMYQLASLILCARWLRSCCPLASPGVYRI